MRQLIRWHCRLSHVAAHTSTLTIFIDDIILKPHIEIFKILSFIGHRPSRYDILNSISSHYNDLINEYGHKKYFDISNDKTHVIYHMINENLIKYAINSIVDEMATTQDLQKWPCKTFNSLKDLPTDTDNYSDTNKKINSEVDADKLPISNSMLVADCSGKYVKCSVPVDKRGG